MSLKYKTIATLSKASSLVPQAMDICTPLMLRITFYHLDCGGYANICMLHLTVFNYLFTPEFHVVPLLRTKGELGEGERPPTSFFSCSAHPIKTSKHYLLLIYH